MKVLAISGSTRKSSSNLQLIQAISHLAPDLAIEVYDSIAGLPHFNPDQQDDLPPVVQQFIDKIRNANGVLICTPEYVFSLPGSLKNALEWTVSTTVFSKKPTALITASLGGEKAHESLQLIMNTLEAAFNTDTQLLISGVRTKVNSTGEITDGGTKEQLVKLIASFRNSIVS